MPANKTVEFTVVGVGQFPVDMLRYDSCYPATSEDAAELVYDRRDRDEVTRRRKVTLRSKSPTAPTEGRWDSFMWKVTQVRRY